MFNHILQSGCKDNDYPHFTVNARASHFDPLYTDHHKAFKGDNILQHENIVIFSSTTVNSIS